MALCFPGLATLGPDTALSPITCGRRTHFSPPMCVSCPTPQCLHKCEAETPPSLQAGMDSGRAQGCVSVPQAGKKSTLPHPYAVSSHCRAAKSEPSASARNSLELSHVQALLETGRHTDNLQHRPEACAVC